ncbi:helix-turn-helix domain-containing protein [Bacillus aerolatus]|uniref:Helix-turn-helix domain-containing protein n=1 Tax=Bacillus aerolatus TaxID=2653354 RepID=A0A6I1FKZ8_9BACI|nr:helix-turn-helix domain-containing protein [Bacillus aerolatus]KAB7706711.1 helix-turn-helix domain-containing protein [Bacillus aerolatus]
MGNLLLLATHDINVINLVHQINNDFKFGFTVEVWDNKSLLKEDLAVKENIAAVLLDLDEMTKVAQDVICDQLTKKKFTLPLVVMKSLYNDHEMRTLFKNGVFDCLGKPLDQEAVYQLLQELKKEAQHSIQIRQQKKDDPLQIMSSLRLSLIYNLLYGNIQNSKDIWDQCQLIGLSSVPNTAMTVQIDEFFSLNKNKSKQLQDTIRNEIITIARIFLKKRLDEILAMGTGADKFAILFSLPSQSSKEEYKQLSKSLADEAKAYIKENTGYSVTIGIGNHYEDVRDLYVSYQEALYAQKYKFFGGKDIVIHIDDVEPFTNEVSLLRNQDVATLASKLMVADMAAVKENMTNLFDQLFSKQKVDPEVLKLQISEISTTLARAAIKGGANLKEVHSILLEYTTDLNTIENLAEMQQWLENMINRFTDLVFNNKNEYSLKSIQKAMDYIEKNYLEQITLEKVANYVHLSPTYFSRLFKSATGTNFVEYITYLRIEKAKALLMDLNYTVYQIALEVGYSNSHYFSRVFKTIVGKTPSDYRNTILGPTEVSGERALN